MEYTDKQLDILKRLGNQLTLTMNILNSHPAVSGKLNILQTVMHQFNLQTEWSTAGKFTKLLMTVRLALTGSEVGTSAAAFAGPAWTKLQNGAYGLMKASLNIKERSLADLLKTFNEIMSLGAVYIATQVLGNWNGLFPKNDPAAAKNAGMLLRELGLTFLLHSRIVEAAYGQVAANLGIDEKSRKLIVDIGLFFLLMVLILTDAEDNPKNEDMIEAFIPSLALTIGSVEQAAQMAQEQGIMAEELGLAASSQVQLMKRALDSNNPGSVREAIENSFQAFEIPYHAMMQDLALINKFTKEMDESFSNIFFQSKLMVTSMTQSA